MKSVFFVSVFCSFLAFNSLPAKASDPCETVICMMGKVTGNSGGSECTAPERDFFNIVKRGRKGRFLPSETADARKGMLTQCPTARPSEINQIIKKFGKKL
ncbi:conjugal transfer protein (plasmid) [Aeromonas salmonicida]|jgi:hypothetical protein|nr:TrbM/KikA/MpfK family conjugal transfer protein [Aeromonas salmonicida]ARW85304.1 conjugal transfer protein [Aeromonas salmonicida]